jgi:hypothetical protein
MLIDSLTGNHMGYDVPLPEAIKSFRDYRSGFVDEYPIINGDGNSELHRLWFYTFSELEEPLKKSQVKIEKIWGIHILTSLIPYSKIQSVYKGRFGKIVKFLAYIDRIIAAVFPFNRFGTNMVIIGKKIN